MFRTGVVPALVALGAWLLATHGAQASRDDVLIGLDEKIVFTANGQENRPDTGKDAVLVMDVSNPAHPRIRASLPLVNSVLGPPTNLQITPDGTLGLVANSVVMTQKGNAWTPTPDNKLYVIDLTANPPKLIDTVAVGRQPSGLAISRKGDLALIADRAGRSVSVVSIRGKEVKLVNEVPMGNEVAAVVIAPDGKRAFACMNLVNKIAVLTIDGQTVSYDKTLDIPAAFNPYNIDITPDGKYVIASNTGAMNPNADAEVVIEAQGPHPHVIDLMTPGTGPEGFAITPNGNWAVAPLLRGSALRHDAWNYTKNGAAALIGVADDGYTFLIGTLPTGAIPEGVAFSPQSDYVYIGNYADRNLQVFAISGGQMTDTGVTLALPGQPASMRGPAR